MGRLRQEARSYKKVVHVAVLFCFALMLSSCGGSGGATGGGTASGADFSQPSQTALPVIDATLKGVDISHADEGYVVARYSSASRLKLQVSKDGESYNYDLPNDNTPTVYPVNMGDGTYLFRIMENTTGNNYVELTRSESSVSLSSEFAPFLLPNQFCNYDASSTAVAQARELTSSVTNQGEAVKAICEYVASNVTYDTDKAKRLSSVNGYIPDPDETLASKSGICFDYASLAAAMLRSQGIPTKIITGYVSPGDLYHAWIMVYIDGTWHTGKFTVDPKTWSRLDLTFAAAGSTEFTGDGASYRDRYIY